MRFNIHVIEVSEGDNVWKYTHTKKMSLMKTMNPQIQKGQNFKVNVLN